MPRPSRRSRTRTGWPWRRSSTRTSSARSCRSSTRPVPAEYSSTRSTRSSSDGSLGRRGLARVDADLVHHLPGPGPTLREDPDRVVPRRNDHLDPPRVRGRLDHNVPLQLRPRVIVGRYQERSPRLVVTVEPDHAEVLIQFQFGDPVLRIQVPDDLDRFAVLGDKPDVEWAFARDPGVVFDSRHGCDGLVLRLTGCRAARL